MFRKIHSRLPTEFAALFLIACCIGREASAAERKSPSLFAPGVISGPANDLSPAFSPDGLTVFFTRSNASYSFILVSHRDGDRWSDPRIAPFSGTWRDLEPTMSPDGSFLIFSSNRPSAEGKGQLDGVYDGKTYPGGGGNLWRVDRHGDSWGEPVCLPNSVNSSSAVFSPSIAGDGSLYFMQADPSTGTFHLFRSAYRAGTYQAPVKMALGDATTEEVDPAVAPDESFVVYSSRHPQQHDKNRLHIAFHQAGEWGDPIDLGDILNEQGSNIEARLGPDRRTLYFSTNTVPPASPASTPAEAVKILQEMQVWANDSENIWYVSLAPWLDEHRGH